METHSKTAYQLAPANLLQQKPFMKSDGIDSSSWHTNINIGPQDTRKKSRHYDIPEEQINEFIVSEILRKGNWSNVC